ncbi:MAG: HlyD family efflux transporter periplasmic adaptor subunit [Eubacteriales bacterium]|nr:HlyD family efflux transporter periplasmic adaptor subunit [Eubacteriales bacterium]
MKQKQSGRGARSSQPASKIGKSMWLPIIVIALLVFYIGGNFVVSHSRPVETTPAIQVSMDDSITSTGYFFREEQLVDVGDVSMAVYNYADGDKIAYDAPLVTIYKNDESLQNSHKLKEVDSTIEQLEALQNNSYVTNTSQIDQKITTALSTIGDLVDSASFRQLPENLEQLRSYALKSGSMSGDISDIDEQLEKLYQQQSKLEAALEDKTMEINAEYDGYFSQSTDGYESILTLEEIEDLTVSSLKELTSKQPKNSDSCKVISQYTWYYATVLSEKDASRMQEGQSVTLRFSQPSDNISATIYAIRPDEESSEVLVIFTSTEMNKDLVSMRKEVGDIVLDSYEGLKIPKDAVRMKDDQMGVYVLNGTVASFKSIETLYTGSDYYIVKQNVIGNDSLVVNDDVIVHAKDVEDKKVVR